MTTHTGHAVVESVRDVIAPCGVERVKAAVQRAIDGRVAEVVAQRDKAAEDAAAQQRWREMATKFMEERNELALRLAPTQRERDRLQRENDRLRARLEWLEMVRVAAKDFAHWQNSANLGRLEKALEISEEPKPA